ncbi:MAG: AAA family ATPase [Runella sp.]
MRISSLKIENFKRFSNLSIINLPPSAKLVLLIGANGSGKSSVFDAFDWLYKLQKTYHNEDKLYYRKEIEKDSQIEIKFHDGTTIEKTKYNQPIPDKKFYGRSSNRIVPRLQNQSYQLDKLGQDIDAPLSYIDNDTRFLNDVYAYIQEINNALREPIFSGRSADTLQIFQEFIKPFNESLSYIFGEDLRTTIQIAEFEDASPDKPAKLVFRKGEIKINYDLLSHGEKQVVILLLNFVVRKKFYDDALIFIDEMDCHLNTSIQYRLLEEIINKWVPDSAQLWTASHALGFKDYAHKSEQAAIIDFDMLDFDSPQTLSPQPKDTLEVYEIAVPKVVLTQLMSGRRLVFCENKNDEYYNLMLLPNTVFVGVKDAREVFLNVKKDSRYFSLRDRDYLSNLEIERIQQRYPNHRILKYYNFENYLYHPDNIAQIAPADFDKQGYIDEIISQKKQKLSRKILPHLTATRQTYEEFKTDPNLRDKDVETIVAELESDEFEVFYKFFNMRDLFDKTILSAYNFKKEDLVKTDWFKNAISSVLKIESSEDIQ